MNVNQKIDVVVAVLDELVLLCFSTPQEEENLIKHIRQILADYVPHTKPTKADTTVQTLKKLADLNPSNRFNQFNGINRLAEKALTELHNDFLKEIEI